MNRVLIHKLLKIRLEELSGRAIDSGWPDLLWVNPGEKAIAVEVKGPNDSLKINQAEMHEVLRNAGLLTVVAYVDENGIVQEAVGPTEDVSEFTRRLKIPDPQAISSNKVVLPTSPYDYITCRFCGGTKRPENKICAECFEVLVDVGVIPK
jgi:hypothetical protein